MQTEKQITFLGLSVKTIVVHTVTYFIMGLLALTFLEYKTAFAEPITREYMRQVDEPIVALGPALQFIRGILFAIAFYPLRESLFGRKNGWLIMWSLLVTLGILSTFAAAPGSAASASAWQASEPASSTGSRRSSGNGTRGNWANPFCPRRTVPTPPAGPTPACMRPGSAMPPFFSKSTASWSSPTPSSAFAPASTSAR